MTKIEYSKCVKLMYEAIAHAKQSDKYYADVRDDKSLTDTQRETKELQGQNTLGYAEGINQVLAAIGFKHDGMKELSRLI